MMIESFASIIAALLVSVISQTRNLRSKIVWSYFSFYNPPILLASFVLSGSDSYRKFAGLYVKKY